jgi:ParB-like chromosome segregation protein Spo0J
MGNKFSFFDLMNPSSKAAAGTVDSYEEIYLSPYDVVPGINNFYSTENIEELADTFLLVGQQEPTVLGRVNGVYRIINGHRRNLANILNIERGHEEYREIRYLYKDMSETMYELSLLVGNAFNRELSDYEKTEQASRLKQALKRARDEDGIKIPGRLRDIVADLLNESTGNIAIMEAITNNATKELKEAFKDGSLGITATYEAAKLPPEEQNEIAAKAADGEEVRAKEIAMKTAEKVARKTAIQAADAREKAARQADKTERDIENAERKQIEAEKEAIKAEEAAREAKIFRDYTIEQAKKSAENTVSETDTWSIADWVKYTLSELLTYTEKVTEEDLYTLQDILRRCNQTETDKGEGSI